MKFDCVRHPLGARVATVLTVTFVSTLLAGTAAAQSPAGHLSFYFDRDAEKTGHEVREFAPFQVHLLAVFEGGEAIGSTMSAWEASIDVDPRVTVTQRTLRHDALNLGPQIDDFFVGLGSVVRADDSPVVLVTYDCVLLQPGVEGAALRVTNRLVTAQSNFSPAWLEEVSGEIIPFDSWGGAVVNPTKESWGSMKERYGG